MYAPAPLWLATIVVALTGLAALSPMGAAAARGGNDRVPVVELPLTQAQVNANMAKLVASIEEQIDALRSMLAVRVGPDADYVKRQQAPTNVTDLPPAANCTDLTCVRTAINAVVCRPGRRNQICRGSGCARSQQGSRGAGQRGSQCGGQRSAVLRGLGDVRQLLHALRVQAPRGGVPQRRLQRQPHHAHPARRQFHLHHLGACWCVHTGHLVTSHKHKTSTISSS